MTGFRRSWLTSTPAQWVFGAVFLFAAEKLSVLIPAGTAGAAGQDVYYIVSHDSYVLYMVLVFALFAGIYALLPKLVRHGYRQSLGKLHFWLAFAGVNMSLLPMLIVPRCCMPPGLDGYARAFAIMNGLSLAGLLTCAFAMLTFVAMLVEAFMRGAPRTK